MGLFFSYTYMTMNVLKAVITHKDFEWKDLSEDELKTYLVLTPNEIKTNLPNVSVYDQGKYDNRLFSEFSALKFIRDKVKFDWITISHYRRRFNYSSNMTIPMCLNNKTNNYEVYKNCHNIKDLDKMDYIVFKKLGKTWYDIWQEMLKDVYFIPYNICNVNKDVFCEWIDLCTTCLDAFIDFTELRTYEETKIYVENHIDLYKNKDVGYQVRICSFLFERLTNMYWRMYIKNNNNLPSIVNPLSQANVQLLENSQNI